VLSQLSYRPGAFLPMSRRWKPAVCLARRSTWARSSTPASSTAACSLRARPRGRTEKPPELNRALYQPELDGHGVDLPGIEPGTSALPRRRATDCATSPYVRDRGIEPRMSCSQSRRVNQLPRPGYARPAASVTPPVGLPCMPSTVEFSTISPTGPKAGDRRGDTIRTCDTRVWNPLL
jgi:hypothetical protein